MPSNLWRIIRAVQEVEAKRQLDEAAVDKRFRDLKAANDNLRQQLKAANENYVGLKNEIEELKKAVGRR
jgi:uncharacterized protein YaaN involved in tellurite resistance